MINCPHCDSEINEDFNFCPQCTKQIKCIKCGKSLGTSLVICPYCGVSLQANATSQTINEYSFLEEKEGDKYKRSITLKATDNAVEKFSGLIIPNSQSLITTLTKINNLEQDRGQSPQPEEKLLLTSEVETMEDAPISISTGVDASYKLIKDYIFPLDDKLEIKLTKFQGNSFSENQRRFILLFVGAFQNYFPRQVASREQIISKARNLGLWNHAFSHLITILGKQYLVENEDGLRLSPTGKQEVAKIINEIINPDETPANNSSKGRKNNRGKLKLGIEKEQKLNEWINSLGDIRGFDARDIQKVKNRQKIQFGLWILKKTCHLNQVPLPLLIEFIIRAFPTIGGTKDSLGKAATGDKFFGRTHSGEYFLTKDGEADIEQLLPDELKGENASN